ncbi:unnamed protein product [Phytophthora fragariaefolia]|uniref:Unnamed protein product n=1 Tax=Phytophthora fragariaefolia TaxID=1490495 RepID=A0A9W6X9T0_9STRA|nr:unnamed protein product [Phytophthora fragariaefolia]
MISLERMDDFVFDELVDFFQASDELDLPTALMFDDLDHDELFTETEALLGSNVPNVLPILPTPAVETATSTAIDAPETVPGQPQQRSKDAVRRSIYRQRKKTEKEALRREIDELSAKLDKLQDSPTDAPTSCNQLSSDLINDLCGLLKKRVHDGAIANGGEGEAPRHKRMRLEPTDSALLEAFVQELNTIYLQADEVIGACGLDASEIPVVTKSNDGRGEYFQHADRQVLPFKFKQVCRSVWDLAQLKHRQEGRQIYEGMGDPDDTIAMKFRITSQRMGETVSLLQRVVVRRFQEAERVVVVWKVFTEGEGLFRGMHSDETGWSIARPSSRTTSTGTILDTCFRHVPMHFSSAVDAPVVDEFSSMVVSTGEEENRTVMQALEKMLLDDTLAN